MIARAPTAAELLNAWEASLTQAPAARALALLAAASRDTAAEVARLSIGRRDAALLTLRQHAFGSRIECLAACPACAEPVEIAFDVDQVRAEPLEEVREPLTLMLYRYVARFRLPTTADLSAVAAAGSLAGARQTLLARCLLSAERDGAPCAADALPEEVVAAISERMAAADPQAEIELRVACPACAAEWPVRFDISVHLWQEVNAWARRLLADVHALASAYGWSERAVLAMSPLRRGLYLEMAGR